MKTQKRTVQVFYAPEGEPLEKLLRRSFLCFLKKELMEEQEKYNPMLETHGISTHDI